MCLDRPCDKNKNCMSFISYAQNYEDVMLWRALKNIENGFYIDVGAAWPDEDSVTKAFYDRGWRGINIEPNPSHYASLKIQRPRDINLKVAAGDKADTMSMNFLGESGLSTLIEEIANQHQASGWKITQKTVTVQTLQSICESYISAGQVIHFLKIDVEGFEAEVLRGHDWIKYRPWIVLVEATSPMTQRESYEAWEPILKKADYIFAYADGLNRYYVSQEKATDFLKVLQYPPNVFDSYIRIQQHESAQKEQRALEGVLAIQSQADQLHQQLAHAQTQEQQTKEQLQQTLSLAQTAQAQADQLNQQLAQAHTQDQQTKEQLQQALSLAQTAQAQADQLNQQLSQAHTQEQQTKEQLQQALSLAQTAQTQADQLHQQLAQAHAQEQQTKEQLQQALSLAQSAQAQADQLHQQLAQAHTQEQQTKEQLQQALSLTQSAQAQADHLNQQLAQAHTQEQQTKEQLQQALSLAQSAQAQADQLNQQLAQAHTQEQQTKEQLQQALSLALAMQSQGIEQAQQLQQLHQQALSKQNAEALAQLAQVQAELDQVHQSNHHHWTGLQKAQEELQNTHQANHHHWLQTQALQAQIAAIQNSWSWTLTAPLRWGAGFLLRPITSVRALANRILGWSINTFQTPLAKAMAWVMTHKGVSEAINRWLQRRPHLHAHLVAIARKHGILPTPPVQIEIRKEPPVSLTEIPPQVQTLEPQLTQLSPRARQIYLQLQMAITTNTNKRTS
jgi:FkbM family methyltransferase